MIYVIGSGPAGVSAALALLKKGRRVTLLDAGFELEPERAAVVEKLRTTPKHRWNPKEVGALRENMTAGIGGVDLKRVYGSDYPYRGMDRYQPVRQQRAKMVRSLAKGGLSTVWGGSILPYRAQDIRDWPIAIRDLEPHYRAVLSFMVHSGRKDALDAVLPLYDERYQELEPCRQSAALMKDLERYRKPLDSEKLIFGQSRLAVGQNPEKAGCECFYCGLCLYGCPYGSIYSSAATIEALAGCERFDYLQGVMVERIEEKSGQIVIHAKNMADSADLAFRAERVFLAAGLLSSTRILLESLNAWNVPLTIRHSEHFQLPLLRYRTTRGVLREPLHTLSQVYLELLEGSVSDRTVHMQVYGYNDLYQEVMKRLFGKLPDAFPGIYEALMGRLLIIKGYLPSDISSRIVVRLEPGAGGRLVLEGRPNAAARRAVCRIGLKLWKNRRCLKALPLLPMVRIGLPGTGNHSGGSFPMSKRPARFETDTLGKPPGFDNLHVVDSTIFPSIPATTITFTIMANAHRIASAF